MLQDMGDMNGYPVLVARASSPWRHGQDGRATGPVAKDSPDKDTPMPVAITADPNANHCEKSPLPDSKQSSQSPPEPEQPKGTGKSDSNDAAV
jgi:hypothetical protein